MKKQGCISLISCLLLAATVAAQHTDFDIRYLGLRDGLTDRNVQVICHDHEGFVWIGTLSGLVRYDGFEMMPIALPFSPEKVAKKAIVPVTAILEDPAHRIWAATQKGLVMFPPDRSRPVLVTEIVFNSIVQEGENLLLSDQGNVYRLRPNTGNGQPPRPEKINLPTKFSWTSLFPGPNGTFFMTGDPSGTLQIRNDSILRRCPGLPVEMNGKQVNLKNGQFIFRNFGGIHLYRFDERHGQFEQLPPFQKGSNDAGHPYFLADLARRFVENNPGQMPIEIAPSIISAVNSWETDAHGRVWLGTMFGIFVFTARTSQFEHLPEVRGESMRAIFQDGGDLLISALRLRRLSKKSSTHIFQNVPHSRVLLPLDGQRVLAAGEYNGYFILDKKTDSATRLDEENLGHIFSAIHLKNGQIWLLRLNHVFQFFPKTNQSQHLFDLPSDVFLDLVEDRNGQVWLAGTLNLMKMVRDGAGNFAEAQPKILGSFTDALLRGDSLWLGTRGSGLVCFDLKTETVLDIFTTDDGLPNDIVNCLLPDAAGNIWLSTNAGLSRFDPKNQVFLNFSQRDGLEMDEYNMSSAFRDPATGRLFFGGMNGVTHFDPAAVQKFLIPPQLLFSKIVKLSADAGNLTTFLPENEVVKKDSLKKNEPEITLAAGDRYLEIHLATTDPAISDQVKFVYRLDGFDNGWVSTGKTNTARFAMLPAGNYLFRAKTITREGVFSPERTIRVRVEAVFYKKWWFVLAVLAVAAGVVWIEWRRRLGHLKNIFQVRKRIADDLHDDVASSLNYLSMLVKSLRQKTETNAEHHETAEKLTQIESVNDEVIGKLSDIVWAIDERSQTLGDLVERMQDYGEDLLLQNNVPLDFQIRLEHAEKTASLAVRQHVLLIFKEAVSNIVRHTKTYAANIQIENRSDNLEIHFENLFSETRKPQFSTGKGLESMTKRAENLAGKLQIEYEEGVFRVKLYIPQIFD